MFIFDFSSKVSLMGYRSEESENYGHSFDRSGEKFHATEYEPVQVIMITTQDRLNHKKEHRASHTYRLDYSRTTIPMQGRDILPRLPYLGQLDDSMA